LTAKDAGLATVGDAFRFAVARFEEARLAYGHGTANARDEAAFVVLEGLHLPIGELDSQRLRKLTGDERARLTTLIDGRIATRKPASYLLNRAYMRGTASMWTSG
jgi:ribosomal protein L3 glutamine methyltransferase